MVSLATQTDRTLFFDFLPLELGSISGFTTKFQLYTVPGDSDTALAAVYARRLAAPTTMVSKRYSGFSVAVMRRRFRPRAA